jgi:Flp pilus assembly protein TadG
MLCFLSRAWRSQKGNATVEFALFLPFFTVLMVGGLELGNAARQASMIEKSLRAGALYAARSDLPLTAAIKTNVENVVKTGTENGTGSYMVPGWAKATATLTIDTTKKYVFTPAAATPLDTDVEVVVLTAAVPYQPLLPGLMGFVGLGDIVFQLTHEQAYVGI